MTNEIQAFKIKAFSIGDEGRDEEEDGIREETKSNSFVGIKK